LRKRERAEGDLVLLCWGLALPWPVRKRNNRAFKDSRRWGVGMRARMVQSRDRAAWVMAPVIRRETGGPFQVVPRA
jgi:hypothetical protein